MAKIGKYLYGIIGEKHAKPLDVEGIGSLKRPVEYVNYRDISAAISDTIIKEYDPTKELLRGHEKVIAALMKNSTIIPCRFGTVAKDKKSIIELLETHYESFIEQLENLNNKIELGFVVSWKKDDYSKDIETQEIQELKKKLMGKPEKLIFEDKIELGKLVEAATEAKRKIYRDEILQKLNGLYVEHKVNDIMNIRMIFNGSFLVDRSCEPDFDIAVDQLYQKYRSVMDFRYSGPWAPYNFVSITIN